MVVRFGCREEQVERRRREGDEKGEEKWEKVERGRREGDEKGCGGRHPHRAETPAEGRSDGALTAL
jgi:hypothetical protein